MSKFLENICEGVYLKYSRRPLSFKFTKSLYKFFFCFFFCNFFYSHYNLQCKLLFPEFYTLYTSKIKNEILSNES